jgi:hypothetical protein
MGQFKPMVKMMTTEPTVELKLAKGGIVKMKKGGSAKSPKKMASGGMGALGMLSDTPALVGRPAVNAPVRAPGKPSMAMRRKAMMAKPMAREMSAAMPSAPMMKEGGKADMAQDKAMVKKAFKQHDMQEHKGGKGTKLALKKGGKSHYATGGSVVSEKTSGSYATTEMHTAKPDRAKGPTGDVKLGNGGGFKRGGKVMKKATGGAIPSETTSGSPATTIMHQAKPDNSKGVTGGVRYGNAGGFNTGGVAMSNAGGYKHGGKASKKAFATGGSVNDAGRPVALKPRGVGAKPSPAVAISRLSGTYKAGGKVAPGNRKLEGVNRAENATNLREAKKDTRLLYDQDTYQGQKIPAMPTMKKRGGMAC